MQGECIGRDLFKWNNKFNVFNENINTELYVDILKEKWNERFMRKIIYINER